VFLTLTPALRLARLQVREVARYGATQLTPGGSLYHAHEAFMTWAATYDVTGSTGRSRALHELWLAGLPPRIKVHRLDSECLPEELMRLCGRVVGM